jgi:hypothetical protein
MVLRLFVLDAFSDTARTRSNGGSMPRHGTGADVIHPLSRVTRIDNSQFRLAKRLHIPNPTGAVVLDCCCVCSGLCLGARLTA